MIQRLEETARHYVTSPRYFPTDNQITFPPGLHPLLHHPDTLLPFHLTNYTKLLQPAVILPGLSPNHLKPLTPLLPNPTGYTKLNQQWRRRWRELPQAGCPGLLLLCLGLRAVAAAVA